MTLIPFQCNKLPHPATMTHFDPKFIDLIPGAKTDLASTEEQLRTINEELEGRKKEISKIKKKKEQSGDGDQKIEDWYCQT